MRSRIKSNGRRAEGEFRGRFRRIRYWKRTVRARARRFGRKVLFFLGEGDRFAVQRISTKIKTEINTRRARRTAIERRKPFPLRSARTVANDRSAAGTTRDLLTAYNLQIITKKKTYGIYGFFTSTVVKSTKSVVVGIVDAGVFSGCRSTRACVLAGNRSIAVWSTTARQKENWP